MKRNEYNYLWHRLDKDELYKKADEKFFDSAGNPLWGKYLKYSDDFGFDKRYIGENGGYIQRITLPEGKKIIRYGAYTGAFTTDEGIEYEKLSLPYVKESMPYHEYIVTGECEVLCLVDKGIVAPGFNSVGGVVQYRHYYPIYQSIRIGILKEDTSWLKKKK